MRGPEPSVRPKGAETESHGAESRALCEAQRFGTLATLTREPAGYPFGSVVAYALDGSGDPLLLLSALAEHTGNIRVDPRASLLVVEPARSSPASSNASRGCEPRGPTTRQVSPLALARVTLLGRVESVPSDGIAEAHARYVAAHPEGERYLQLPDFTFYRLRVEGVRFVGGFGRMSWVEITDYASGGA
jgi:putative heme iron utilization protein